MVTTTRLCVRPSVSRASRRFGYGIAVVVNVAMLFITANILEWGWLPFLTNDFARVAGWIGFSLLVSIGANVVYMFEDGSMIKALGELVIGAVSVSVTYRILTVFPFDFSAYEFDWNLVTKIVLILAMVGAGIGALMQVAKLTRVPQQSEAGGVEAPGEVVQPVKSRG